MLIEISLEITSLIRAHHPNEPGSRLQLRARRRCGGVCWKNEFQLPAQLSIEISIAEANKNQWKTFIFHFTRSEYGFELFFYFVLLFFCLSSLPSCSCSWPRIAFFRRWWSPMGRWRPRSFKEWRNRYWFLENPTLLLVLSQFTIFESFFCNQSGGMSLSLHLCLLCWVVGISQRLTSAFRGGKEIKMIPVPRRALACFRLSHREDYALSL